MRFLVIIFATVFLVAGNFAGCRKNKQPAMKKQIAGQTSPQSDPQIGIKADSIQTSEVISSIKVQNQQNKPNLTGETTKIISETRVEANRPPDVNKSADPNRSADPNMKTTKSQSEPNARTNKEQPLQPLAKFQNKYAEVLSENVNTNGMVNYRKLKTKRADLYNLLDQLRRFDPNEYNAMSKEEKTAFWINAYNIKMLSIIIDNYPIESEPLMRFLWASDSVLHIGRKIGVFEKQKIIVMSEEFTLEEIEQNIFYKQLNEPMAFFALTHASLSGPPLRNEPYSGKKLDEQFDDQIKKYLTDRNNFQIDTDNRKVFLPAILQGSWYGKYFLDKYGTDKKFKDQRPEVAAVLNCIIKYLPANDAAYLELKNYNVDFLPHNWKINDQ